MKRLRVRNHVEPARPLKCELQNEFHILIVARLLPSPVAFSDTPSYRIWVVEDSAFYHVLAIVSENPPRPQTTARIAATNLKPSKPAASAVDKVKANSDLRPNLNTYKHGGKCKKLKHSKPLQRIVRNLGKYDEGVMVTWRQKKPPALKCTKPPYRTHARTSPRNELLVRTEGMSSLVNADETKHDLDFARKN